jgi:hypothetical protein
MVIDASVYAGSLLRRELSEAVPVELALRNPVIFA